MNTGFVLWSLRCEYYISFSRKRTTKRITAKAQPARKAARGKRRADCMKFCIIYALRQLGYGPGTVTLHGFRAMASTVLNGAGFSSDVIEAQLAHVDRNKVRRAYNRAEYLPQRVELMRWYADFLDKLKAGH